MALPTGNRNHNPGHNPDHNPDLTPTLTLTLTLNVNLILTLPPLRQTHHIVGSLVGDLTRAGSNLTITLT